MTRDLAPIDRDDFACAAGNIASMLWGAESLMAELSFVDEKGARRHDLDAAVSVLRGARQLLEKLADKIDGTGA